MGKTTKAITTTRRREELRKAVPRPVLNLRGVLQRPEFVNTALVLTAFIVISSAVIAWSREQPKVRDNQIMTTTSLKRLTYQVVDEQATSEKREEARKSSPRVYRLNDSYLKRIEAALLGLPKAVAGKASLDDLGRELRKEFNLDAAALVALQPMLVNDEPSREWVAWVSRLVREQLVHSPLLRTQEYGVYSTTLNKALILPDGTREQPLTGQAIEIANDPAQTDARLRDAIERTGFPPPLQKVVVGRLTFDPQPTFTFDEEETKSLAETAAGRIAPEIIRHTRGDVLYRRGDRLTREQVDEVFTEAERYKSDGPIAARGLRWAGIAGLVAIVAVFVGSFAAIAYPRIVRNPLRLAAICSLVISMLALGVIITVNAPIFYRR